MKVVWGTSPVLPALVNIGGIIILFVSILGWISQITSGPSDDFLFNSDDRVGILLIISFLAGIYLFSAVNCMLTRYEILEGNVLIQKTPFSRIEYKMRPTTKFSVVRSIFGDSVIFDSEVGFHFSLLPNVDQVSQMLEERLAQINESN